MPRFSNSNVGNLMRQILEICKIARPGFWLTHLWFYLLPFAKQNMFGLPEFWLGAIYVCFPLGLLLYGWNDIGDHGTDQLNPRKGSWIFGARPNESMRRRLPWIIGAIQIPFLILFVFFSGWKMIGWFAAVLAVNWTYNNLGFKRIAGLDLINQVGYLLIFVLASWLCSVEQLNLPAMIFSSLFAIQSHLFGQIMDIEQDEIDGRRSTSVLIGAMRSKLLLSVIMLIEAAIAYNYFSGKLVGLFMLAGALFFLADAFVGPRKYAVSFVTTFFLAWNLVALVSMYFVWNYGLFLLS